MILDPSDVERHAQRYATTGWIVLLCCSHEELRERMEVAEQRIEKLGEMLKELIEKQK